MCSSMLRVSVSYLSILHRVMNISSDNDVRVRHGDRL
jgi:hypothetical protein